MPARTLFIWTDESKDDLRRCFDETRASKVTAPAFDKELQRRFLCLHPTCRLSGRTLSCYYRSLTSGKVLPTEIFQPTQIWNDEMRKYLKVLHVTRLKWFSILCFSGMRRASEDGKRHQPCAWFVRRSRRCPRKFPTHSLSHVWATISRFQPEPSLQPVQQPRSTGSNRVSRT